MDITACAVYCERIASLSHIPPSMLQVEESIAEYGMDIALYRYWLSHDHQAHDDMMRAKEAGPCPIWNSSYMPEPVTTAAAAASLASTACADEQHTAQGSNDQAQESAADSAVQMYGCEAGELPGMNQASLHSGLQNQRSSKHLVLRDLAALHHSLTGHLV